MNVIPPEQRINMSLDEVIKSKPKANKKPSNNNNANKK
eukprot:gene35806-43430_t